uniref:AIG2-like family protein n=1 Tax=Desulfovibrio sp. U5L TaxID=596152 RepID=I2Q3U8_9BACT
MQRTAETMPETGASPRPVATGRERKLLYFSYGAEMLDSRIRSRCASPKVVATARLADHRLGFYGYSPVWDGGLETVLPALGQEVWGVVYALSFSDADSLDTWQGVRLNGTGAYFHSPAEVTDAQGTAYAVLVFKKDVLGEPTPPSRPYLDAILAGACQHALPPRVIETLQAVPARPAAYPVPKFGLARQPGVLPGESCADCGSLAPPRTGSHDRA